MFPLLETAVTDNERRLWRFIFAWKKNLTERRTGNGHYVCCKFCEVLVPENAWHDHCDHDGHRQTVRSVRIKKVYA